MLKLAQLNSYLEKGIFIFHLHRNNYGQLKYAYNKLKYVYNTPSYRCCHVFKLVCKTFIFNIYKNEIEFTSSNTKGYIWKSSSEFYEMHSAVSLVSVTIQRWLHSEDYIQIAMLYVYFSSPLSLSQLLKRLSTSKSSLGSI